MMYPMVPDSGRPSPNSTMVSQWQELLLSSPFIRWLLENQEMLNGEGVLNRWFTILGAIREGPNPNFGMAPVMMPGQPGVSMEQADPDQFRDLVESVQRIPANRRRLSPSMLSPGTQTVFPAVMMPGRPF